MDSEILRIKPVIPESRVVSNSSSKEPYAVKPIPKDEGALFGRFGKEMAKRQGRKSPSLNTSKAKELSDEDVSQLSDINDDVTVELYDKAGGLIVKMIKPDTREVIRQISSEDLPKPLEKCERLRGVLFARKA